jgi:DNA-binding transcriptional MerR regulator
MRITSLLDFAHDDDLDAVRGEVAFFLIGELANLLDIDPKTIRFYEREGLLSPERHGKFRVFKPKDAHRLRAILRFRKFGLSLSSIREIFSKRQVNSDIFEHHEFTTDVLKNQLGILRTERESLDRAISDIARLLEQ